MKSRHSNSKKKLTVAINRKGSPSKIEMNVKRTSDIDYSKTPGIPVSNKFISLSSKNQSDEKGKESTLADCHASTIKNPKESLV